MAKVVRPVSLRDDEDFAPTSALPPEASVGQRWKFRRNAVIAVAHVSGVSQRTLAEVFDLPRSRVASIVNEFPEPREGRRVVGAGPPPPPPGVSATKRWKYRRNTVIYVAHRNGFSQRALADVFDLPRSRVAAVIREIGESHN